MASIRPGAVRTAGRVVVAGTVTSLVAVEVVAAACVGGRAGFRRPNVVARRRATGHL
ncbi:hypothetical protein [Nocardia sp. NPDC057353]|uniref:hypothetical protein n=1 Tax=Nocardia sp. NPDC057353 TaxID=3346104 RepID=UPI0036352BF5